MPDRLRDGAVTSTRPTAPARLPLAVLVLGATIFCLGTSEFMLAGLLPDLARDLEVGIPAAGGLISGFAVGMVVGAPAMALWTLRLPRRTALLASALVFAVAHLAAVVVDDYATLLATRVVAAVACATFWAVAAVTAVAISPPGATARAMAVVVGGLTVANVVGVPLGTLVGSQGGWRAAFLAVGVLTLVATVATALLVPETREAGDASYGTVLRRELRTFRRAPLWVALGTTALFQAAVFCTFSYLAPVVTDVGGLAEGWVPVVLLAFGVGSVAGSRSAAATRTATCCSTCRSPSSPSPWPSSWSRRPPACRGRSWSPPPCSASRRSPSPPRSTRACWASPVTPRPWPRP
ncbi:MFS transporter [Nocardioides zeae]